MSSPQEWHDPQHPTLDATDLQPDVLEDAPDVYPLNFDLPTHIDRCQQCQMFYEVSDLTAVTVDEEDAQQWCLECVEMERSR